MSYVVYWTYLGVAAASNADSALHHLNCPRLTSSGGSPTSTSSALRRSRPVPHGAGDLGERRLRQRAFYYTHVFADPKNAAPQSTFLFPVKNGLEVNQGKLPPSELGVKAIAIYRDGCKRTQPLNTSMDQVSGLVPKKAIRRRLPAMGPVDISPIVAWFVLIVIRSLLLAVL